MKFLSILCLVYFCLFSAGAAAAQGHPPAAPLREPTPLLPDTVDIFDIKGPIQIETVNMPLIWTACAIIIVLVLLSATFFLWRRKKKSKAAAIPAHEIALDELDKARRFMQQKNGCAYAECISSILRHYIEARFFLSASRQTTREFITGLTDGSIPVPLELSNRDRELKQWLEHCDLAKFARCAPGVKDMKEMEDSIRRFIEGTAAAIQNKQTPDTRNPAL